MHADGRLNGVAEEILHAKVVDFLELNAKIEEGLPSVSTETPGGA